MRLAQWSIVALLVAAPLVARADIPPRGGCRCSSPDMVGLALLGLLVRRKAAPRLG